jgi:hypothetical protein
MFGKKEYSAERSLLDAIVRQKLRLEERVGSLELFRAGWSPDNNGILIDVLYGLSTVMESPPIQTMVRGFLEREIDLLSQGTPVEGVPPEVKSSMIEAFIKSQLDGEMAGALRAILIPLKYLDMGENIQQRMQAASSAGALSSLDSRGDSTKPEGSGGEIDSEIPPHLKTTSVSLAGSILFLIYALDVFERGRGFTTGPKTKKRTSSKGPGARVLESEYSTVIRELLSEIQTGSTRARATAYSALGQVGNMREDVMEGLTKGLTSRKPADRRNAAWAIGRNMHVESEAHSPSSSPDVSDSRLLSALEQTLDDPIPRVASVAALALGGLGPAAVSVVPELERHLSDPNLFMTFRLALDSIVEKDAAARAFLITRWIKNIRREDPLLDIGLEVEKRDFGGPDRGGGMAMCMCTFS